MVKALNHKGYVVTRINPSVSDHKVFIDGCTSLGASYFGYAVTPTKTKVVFEGWVILLSSQDTSFIERLFPNFLVILQLT